MKKKPIKEMQAAHRAVRYAVMFGRMDRPLNCSQCNREGRPGCGDIQAHHDDYSKPLDVRWLCWSCHALHHHALARATGVGYAKSQREVGQ
jgi:hypothetical protein